MRWSLGCGYGGCRDCGRCWPADGGLDSGRGAAVFPERRARRRRTWACAGHTVGKWRRRSPEDRPDGPRDRDLSAVAAWCALTVSHVRALRWSAAPDIGWGARGPVAGAMMFRRCPASGRTRKPMSSTHPLRAERSLTRNIPSMVRAKPGSIAPGRSSPSTTQPSRAATPGVR